MRGFDRVVLCGMGGSSLAPLGAGRGVRRPRCTCSTRPIPTPCGPSGRTGSLFVIASKSGSTLEPEVMEEYFFDARRRRRVALRRDHRPRLGARRRAPRSAGSGACSSNRADIGGRYSALSYFGLVPAALAGVDDRAAARPRRGGARAVRARCRPADNAPLQLGALLGDGVAQGRDKLTIIADPALGPFGLWLEQLIAESTGKEGTGVVPLADEPLGAARGVRRDRVFAYLRRDGAPRRAVAALEGAGHPVRRAASSPTCTTSARR